MFTIDNANVFKKKTFTIFISVLFTNCEIGLLSFHWNLSFHWKKVIPLAIFVQFLHSIEIQQISAGKFGIWSGDK